MTATEAPACHCFLHEMGNHTEACRLRARVKELELENSNLRVRDSNVTAHCLNVNAINEDYRDKLAAADKYIATLEAEVVRVRDLIDRDRTGLASAIAGMLKLLDGWSWLTRDEWASYSWEERTERTLRTEIREAWRQLEELGNRGLNESGARADCAFRPSKPDRGAELDELRGRVLELETLALTLDGIAACAGRDCTRCVDDVCATRAAILAIVEKRRAQQDSTGSAAQQKPHGASPLESDCRSGISLAGESAGSNPAAAESRRDSDDPRCWPCANCPKMRTAAEGGNVFTVCEACWDAGRKPEPAPIPVTRNFICLACGTRLRTDPSKPVDSIDGCAFCPMRTSAELTKWIEGTAPAPVSDDELRARVWEEAAGTLDMSNSEFICVDSSADSALQQARAYMLDRAARLRGRR